MNAQKAKYFLLIFLSIYQVTAISAQSSTLSAGGDASSGTGSFSFSIGQVAYEQIENTTFKVYQGVQQPYLAPTTNQINPIAENSLVSLFPNPATDVVFIQNIQITKNLSYRMTDASGKILRSGNVNEDKTAIDIAGYSPGIYFLFILNPSNTQQTYTLIKK
jgi:hypothetical protein